MRTFCSRLALSILLLSGGRPAFANCAVVDQIITLHAVQTRLLREPDAGLFASDIRHLRRLNAQLHETAALDVIRSDQRPDQERNFVEFFQNTSDLLDRAGHNDPQLIRRHFTADRQRNLRIVGAYLIDLQCPATIGRTEVDILPTADASDAQDMATITNTFGNLADRLFRWRTVIVGIIVVLAVYVGFEILKRWLSLRRRRVRRYNANYKTRYRVDGRALDGTLLDISCFGTKIRHQADQPITNGQAIELLLADDWHKATAMWNNQHYTGVKFATRIKQDKVAIIRDKTTADNLKCKTAP